MPDVVALVAVEAVESPVASSELSVLGSGAKTHDVGWLSMVFVSLPVGTIEAGPVVVVLAGLVSGGGVGVVSTSVAVELGMVGMAAPVGASSLDVMTEDVTGVKESLVGSSYEEGSRIVDSSISLEAAVVSTGEDEGDPSEIEVPSLSGIEVERVEASSDGSVDVGLGGADPLPEVTGTGIAVDPSDPLDVLRVYVGSVADSTGTGTTEELPEPVKVVSVMGTGMTEVVADSSIVADEIETGAVPTDEAMGKLVGFVPVSIGESVGAEDKAVEEPSVILVAEAMIEFWVPDPSVAVS